MTRKADHLREYFIDYVGTMISVAFSGYYTFAGQHEDAITLAGCLMHARRPIALSAAVKGAAKLPEEEQKAMPEYRLLQLMAQIFDLEKSFRGLSADERKTRRNEKVCPLMDEYFQIIHTLDPDNPEYSKKAGRKVKEAVKDTAEQIQRDAMLNIVIQFQSGHAVSALQICQMVPEGTTDVYVKAEEGKLYYVLRDGSTGSVDLW